MGTSNQIERTFFETFIWSWAVKTFQYSSFTFLSKLIIFKKLTDFVPQTYVRRMQKKLFPNDIFKEFYLKHFNLLFMRWVSPTLHYARNNRCYQKKCARFTLVYNGVATSGYWADRKRGTKSSGLSSVYWLIENTVWKLDAAQKQKMADN